MAKEEKSEIKETIKENKEVHGKDTSKETPKQKKQEGKDIKKGKPPSKDIKKESHKPGEEGKEEIRHIVRIADTDLEGKRSVMYAMTGIKGINRRAAKILVAHSGIDPMKTLGYLEDSEIQKIQLSVDNISTVMPIWMMNKQNDFISGEDRHVYGTDVYMSLNEDLNIMKKTRSYKGLRHERGLRVRGQRTRSTGRRGRTVGVTRTSLGAKAKKPEESKGGK